LVTGATEIKDTLSSYLEVLGAPPAVVTGLVTTSHPSPLSGAQTRRHLSIIVGILLVLGAIGAWAGWSLGTHLVDSHSSGAFDPPGPRRWRMAFAIAFALVSVVLGMLLLTYLDA
jgi:hypothetical protein